MDHEDFNLWKKVSSFRTLFDPRCHGLPPQYWRNCVLASVKKPLAPGGRSRAATGRSVEPFGTGGENTPRNRVCQGVVSSHVKCNY